jgi:ubiquinone/menaquinone biosynthesis C-methylase UbiE
MSAYSALAEHYDALMAHADYETVVRYLCTQFHKANLTSGDSILDLACGTGTVALALAKHGYDVIGIDASPDMLSAAAQKTNGSNPMWLCQSMQMLDLNDTVDAAVCCFDGVNYLHTLGNLRRAFRRVHLFLKPGGLFVFDALPPERMADMDGKTFSSESESAYCTWRPLHTRGKLTIEIDLFTREGSVWRRHMETHHQRAFTRTYLTETLASAGFNRIHFSGKGRWWITARKPK